MINCAKETITRQLKIDQTGIRIEILILSLVSGKLTPTTRRTIEIISINQNY